MFASKIDSFLELSNMVATMHCMVIAPFLHSQWAINRMASTGAQPKGESAFGQYIAQFFRLRQQSGSQGGPVLRNKFNGHEAGNGRHSAGHRSQENLDLDDVLQQRDRIGMRSAALKAMLQPFARFLEAQYQMLNHLLATPAFGLGIGRNLGFGKSYGRDFFGKRLNGLCKNWVHKWRSADSISKCNNASSRPAMRYLGRSHGKDGKQRTFPTFPRHSYDDLYKSIHEIRCISNLNVPSGDLHSSRDLVEIVTKVRLIVTPF